MDHKDFCLEEAGAHTDNRIAHKKKEIRFISLWIAGQLSLSSEEKSDCVCALRQGGVRHASLVGVTHLIDGGLPAVLAPLLPLILPIISSALKRTPPPTASPKDEVGGMQRGEAGAGEGVFSELLWHVAESLIFKFQLARDKFATDILEAAFQIMCSGDAVPGLCCHVCQVLSRIVASRVLSDTQVQLVDVITSLHPKETSVSIALASLSISRIYASRATTDKALITELFFRLRTCGADEATLLINIIPPVLLRFLGKEDRSLLTLGEFFSEAIRQPCPRPNMLVWIARIMSWPGLVHIKARKRASQASTSSMVSQFVVSCVQRAGGAEGDARPSPLHSLLCLFLALSTLPQYRAMVHGITLANAPLPDHATFAFAGSDLLLQESMYDATVRHIIPVLAASPDATCKALHTEIDRRIGMAPSSSSHPRLSLRPLHKHPNRPRPL